MRRDWRSWKLKRPTLALALCVEAGLIAGIATTAILTKRRDGFVNVSRDPIGTLRGIPISSRLEWSAVPAVVMALFSLLYSAIVTSAAQRQPFVELKADKQESRSNAKLTILLDYLSYPIFYSWWIAGKNRHVHLCAALLTQLLASIMLVPLTSNLFSVATARVPSDVELETTGVLDLSLLTRDTSILAALDLSNAIWGYGAGLPVWMTANRSFETLIPSHQVTGDILVSNVAYGVKPQCVLVPSSQVNATYAANSVLGSILINFADRGCEIDDIDPWPITSSRLLYTYTWKQHCTGSSDAQDRIGIFAAAFDAASGNKLSNLTVISCFPTYWSTSRALTMSFDNSVAKHIVSDEPEEGKDDIQLTGAVSLAFRALHDGLSLTRTQEGSGVLEADSFGRVVHGYARRLRPDVLIDRGALLQATETVYSTFFAALATTELMQQPREVRMLDAQLFSDVTRLFASLPIAYVLIFLLFSMMLSTIGIFVHAERRKSSLQEEPRGLLWWAMILSSSDLMTFVEDFKAQHPVVEKPGEHIEKYWDVKSAKCWCEHRTDEVGGRIRLEDLEERIPGRSSWQKFTQGLRWSRRGKKPSKKSELVEQVPLKAQGGSVTATAEQHAMN